MARLPTSLLQTALTPTQGPHMHSRIYQADLHQPTSVGYPVHGFGSQRLENCHRGQDNCWKTWVSDHTTPSRSLTREGHGDITLPGEGGGCPPVTFSWASELHEPTWKLMVPTSSRVTCGSGDGVSAWQPVQTVSPDSSPGQSNGVGTFSSHAPGSIWVEAGPRVPPCVE